MKLLATIAPCSDGTLRACFPDAEYLFTRDDKGRVTGEVSVSAHIDHLVATRNFVIFDEHACGEASGDAPHEEVQAAPAPEEDEPALEEQQSPSPAAPAAGDEFAEMTDNDLRDEIELRSGNRPAATDERAQLVVTLRALRAA